jgi:hypothetical protein
MLIWIVLKFPYAKMFVNLNESSLTSHIISEISYFECMVIISLAISVVHVHRYQTPHLGLAPIVPRHSWSSHSCEPQKRQTCGKFKGYKANTSDTGQYKQTNSVALSPRANYTDWATATCRWNLVPTFVDRGVSCHQHSRSLTVINLSFLNRSCYFSFK